MSRGVVCVVALAVALSVTGCVGSDSDPVRANGSPATFEADAVADVGYERVGVTNRSLNATLTTTLEGDIEAQESKDVMATIPVAKYRRPGDPPSVLAVASSPVVQLLENPPRSSDPLSTLSTAELVTFVQTTYGDVDDIGRTDDRTVTVLGEETTLVTYRGTATAAGTALDVRVSVARVRDDGDVVTVVAVRPADTDGTTDVGSLLGALEHR